MFQKLTLISWKNTFSGKLWVIANALNAWHFYDYANVVTFDVFVFEKKIMQLSSLRENQKETDQSLRRQKEWKLLLLALETNAC